MQSPRTGFILHAASSNLAWSKNNAQYHLSNLFDPQKVCELFGDPVSFLSLGGQSTPARPPAPAGVSYRIRPRTQYFPKKSADFSGAPFHFSNYYTIPAGKCKVLACASYGCQNKRERCHTSPFPAPGAPHTPFPHLWGSSFIHALPSWRSFHSAHAPAPPPWQTAPLHCQGM